MDRKEVIEITLDLIKEKKLEKTSIGEIVKRLNMSPGSLYYHFKSKNDIFKEVINYSCNEITENLNNVKLNKNKQLYLFDLTGSLINFFEKRNEILNFLLCIRGSSFLEEKLESKNFLENYKKVLINKKSKSIESKAVSLKLKMFIGSIYQVLYENKVIKERNLTKEEIEGINNFFWGEKILDNEIDYIKNSIIM